MGSNFTELFLYYLPPDESTIKSAIESGMVVLDTNVLLSAYRFAPEARNELLSVLETVADRIWLPSRVAEEFHRNRLGVIIDHETAYAPTMEGLRAAQNELNKNLRPKIDQLANRAALSKEEKTNLLELIANSTQAAISAVEGLRRNHGLAGPHTADSILGRFQHIFDRKVGSPFSGDEFNAEVAEAERRIKQDIPPGYQDANKAEPYGDYFVWKQTLLEAAKRKERYLVFVTADKKEDWYQIIKGRVIGARPELAKELLEFANCKLVMLDIASFLFHARQHLDAHVSAETIRQSTHLPQEVTDTNKRQKRNAQDLAYLQAAQSETEQKLASIREKRFEAHKNLAELLSQPERDDRILTEIDYQHDLLMVLQREEFELSQSLRGITATLAAHVANFNQEAERSTSETNDNRNKKH